jgi:hypothetical protein
LKVVVVDLLVDHVVIHVVVVDWLVLRTFSVVLEVFLFSDVVLEVAQVVFLATSVPLDVFCALPVLQKSILENPIFFILFL